jgi:hypothetical protein
MCHFVVIMDRNNKGISMKQSHFVLKIKNMKTEWKYDVMSEIQGSGKNTTFACV